MLNKGKNDKLMSLDTDHDNLLKRLKPFGLTLNTE